MPNFQPKCIFQSSNSVFEVQNSGTYLPRLRVTCTVCFTELDHGSEILSRFSLPKSMKHTTLYNPFFLFRKPNLPNRSDLPVRIRLVHSSNPDKLQYPSQSSSQAGRKARFEGQRRTLMIQMQKQSKSAFVECLN